MKLPPVTLTILESNFRPDTLARLIRISCGRGKTIEETMMEMLDEHLENFYSGA